MKGIKEWANEIENNKEFAKKFEGKENASEIIELAKEEGYEFTEDELMDLKMEVISGGSIIGSVAGLLSKFIQGVGYASKKTGEWISGKNNK